MPEYLAPGVFVEEIDSGSKPIEGVGVNTVAFIGYAKSGEYNKPTFLTNWTQFCQQFGEEENALTAALCDELKMTVADVRTAKKASRKGWAAYAAETIDKTVREKKTSVKNFPDFLRKHNISSSSQPFLEGSYLAHAVYGYYMNGGGRAYVIRVAHPDDIKALSQGASRSVAAPSQSAVPAQLTIGPLQLTAKDSGAAGNDIKIEVEHFGEGNEFKVKISRADITEAFPANKGDKPLTLESVAEPINRHSKLVKLQVASDVATAVRPEAKTFVMAGGADALPARTGSTALAPAGSPLSNGLSNLRADDFIGDEAQRTGLGGLVPLEGVQMIAIPDLMAGLWQREKIPGGEGDEPEKLVITEKQKQAILDAQCMLVAHCERAGNRMAILDPIPGLTPQEMNETTLNTPYNSDFGQGAIYYPWIKIVDPMRRGQQLFVPPCGHIAGVWARVGVERGVHKAPANEFLRGAVDLEVTVTKGEQELLNPNGINCIRSFPGTGIKIWGARTLATVGNPSWKYINVRRLFNYLKDSLDRGMQWAVFEPNDPDLWGRVRRTVSAFLLTEWREGKLFGVSPEEAFYVKCDSETNPQEMIDLGRLYVEIGINPVKPAEFVILRLGQWSGGGSMNED